MYLILNCSYGNWGDTGEFGGCCGGSLGYSISTRSGNPVITLLLLIEVGLLIHMGGLCSKQVLVSFCLLSLGLFSCLSVVPFRAPSSCRAAPRSRVCPGLQAVHLLLPEQRHWPPVFSIVLLLYLEKNIQVFIVEPALGTTSRQKQK